MFLKMFELKPMRRVKNERKSAAIEKINIKPSTMKRGLVLLVCPTEVPRRIGNRGKIQGAAIVKMPAKMAKKI